jgi:arsenical pump membrane protein
VTKALAETVALLLLAATLAFAVVWPRGLPEAVAAVPAALLVVVLGVLPARAAWDELASLGPTIGFLATVLRLRPKPHVYACTHLANSASLLLPVSNLTNLLAFRASGLSFARFAAIMTLPWLAAIGVEWLVLRRFFVSDLVGHGEVVAEPKRGGAPRYAMVVLGLTLVGFGLASLAHLDPAVVAALGALALAVPTLRGRRARPADLGRALALPFLAFVAALGVVVRAVSDAGLGPLVVRLLPTGTSLWSLLAVAVLAAVLANLTNNLPAILLLLPAAAAGGPGTVLACLVGVNVGPNLTYVGSLATLLWRRVLRAHDAEPAVSEFLRLGAITVPAALLAATVALWLMLRVLP